MNQKVVILLSDGANGIKYNLTNDIIESIFKTYPAVKRKHADNVPAKMKEQEFWLVNQFNFIQISHRDPGGWPHGWGLKNVTLDNLVSLERN